MLDIAGLYLSRPTAEYSRAFDAACRELDAADGRALVVASCPAHAVEFLRRCRRPLEIAAAGSFDAEDFVAAAAGWAWGPLAVAQIEDGSPRYAVFAWAEPEARTAAQLARALSGKALPGARLAVVCSSYLRPFLPAWQTRHPPPRLPLAPGAALRRLRPAGWQVERVIAYHGPRAIAWSGLDRLAAGLGRPDWADRCRLAMWSRYQEAGWLWPLAPLALIHARAA